MLLSIFPLAFKYLSIGEEKCSFAVFHTICVLSFIPVSVGPTKNSISWDHTNSPFALIISIIGIIKRTLSFKVPIFEWSFINTRIAYIMTKSLFHSIYKLSFVIWSIGKLLFTFSWRHVVNPMSIIFIALKRIMKGPFSVSFIIFNISLINASIIKNIPALSMGISQQKCSLIIRAVCKKKLTFAIKFTIRPFSMIAAFGSLNLVIRIRKDARTHTFFILDLIGR